MQFQNQRPRRLPFSTKIQLRFHRIIRITGILWMAGIGIVPVSSQQLPRFSQYYSNEFLINPSVAGNDGRTIVNLAARKQWVGFYDYTPSSYLLSVQGRILKRGYSLKSNKGSKTYRKASKGRVGLGGILYSDINGAS